MSQPIGIFLVAVSLKFLLDALFVPARDFTVGAWVAVTIAAGLLYLGASLLALS